MIGCHFRAEVIKTVTCTLVGLYCLLGVDSLVKQAAMLEGPCAKDLRVASSKEQRPLVLQPMRSRTLMAN